jgi:hypothetical protein
MNHIKKIDRREMILRFARGNVGSTKFFPDECGLKRADVSALLNSTDPDEQDQGMAILRLTRWGVLQGIPYGIAWALFELDVSGPEFTQLEAIHDQGWRDLTQQTGLLIKAIEPLHQKLATDDRIIGIRHAIRNEQFVQWEGITIVGPSIGPYEVKEGHGRLVSRYLEWKAGTPISPVVEVALGTW